MPTKIGNQAINNSNRPLRVTVDKDDITMGKPLDPEQCAAAQAVLRCVSGVDAVKVHRSVVYLRINKRWQRYRTSAALRLETIVFDRGGQFIEGEYDLLPVPVNEIIRKAQPKRAASSPAQKFQRKPRRRTWTPGTRKTANGWSGDDEE